MFLRGDFGAGEEGQLETGSAEAAAAQGEERRAALDGEAEAKEILFVARGDLPPVFEPVKMLVSGGFRG